MTNLERGIFCIASGNLKSKSGRGGPKTYKMGAGAARVLARMGN